MPKEIYDNVVMLPFEGEEYSCPAMYKEWLERIYGKTYMTPPPENKRKNHKFKAYEIQAT